MKFNEISHIKIEIDGTIVSTTHKDLNDAWADTINRLEQAGRKAVITQTITIEKV
jgi:hydroxymethylpyrimidine pyrophosphatase-like HAD family hydrolase